MGASPEERLLQIGRNIAEIRMRQGLTQEQLATKAYVSDRELRRHEAGQHLTIDALLTYARVLDCPFEALSLMNPDYRVIELIQCIPESGRDSVISVLNSIVAGYSKTG